MHYYQFNIADYQSHTRHLSPIEDICYRRMLDWIYLHEKPLPENSAEVARLLLLKEYLTDVERVLNEYFKLVEHGWVNVRALVEIDAFKDKVNKASQAGKASGEARKNKIKQSLVNTEQTFNERSTEVEPNINHKPLTINHNISKKPNAKKIDFFADISQTVLNDYLAVRKAKRASPITQTVYDSILRESQKAGITVEQALIVCIERSWVGFKADWYASQVKSKFTNKSNLITDAQFEDWLNSGDKND